MEERERDTVDQTTFQGSVPAQELPGGRSQWGQSGRPLGRQSGWQSKRNLKERGPSSSCLLQLRLRGKPRCLCQSQMCAKPRCLWPKEVQMHQKLAKHWESIWTVLWPFWQCGGVHSISQHHGRHQSSAMAGREACWMIHHAVRFWMRESCHLSKRVISIN